MKWLPMGFQMIRKLEEGDLIKYIDVSGSKNGYFADTGLSIVVGNGDQKVLVDLCEIAKITFE